jgi:hypothetical protein
MLGTRVRHRLLEGHRRGAAIARNATLLLGHRQRGDRARLRAVAQREVDMLLLLLPYGTRMLRSCRIRKLVLQ